jgi:catechol 2,3-dioxygenase-like lactoylglutathione lyase family enzyme
MIEHVSLRCTDPRKSRDFYEKILAPLGYKLSKSYGSSYGFIQNGRHDFWVTPGRPGTPLHLAFHAEDKRSVEKFHQAALKAGAKDNGPPGMREDYGYAAFALDPDGHNIEAVVWPEELKAENRAGKKSAPREQPSAKRSQKPKRKGR